MLNGAHNEKGVRYLPGAVIESTRDLDKVFLNKFERIRSSRQRSESVEEAKAADKPVVLATKHKGRGRYDVINTVTEKRINDEYLTKAQAEAMVASAVEDEVEE